MDDPRKSSHIFGFSGLADAFSKRRIRILTIMRKFVCRSIRLVLHKQRPWSEKLSRRKPKFSAGQWVYLYVPYDNKFLSICPPVGHPFSIANAPRPNVSGDELAVDDLDKLELHIGIIGREHLEFTNSVWEFPAHEPRSWTDKLRERILKGRLTQAEAEDPLSIEEKTVYVVGPYGTAFESCFKPEFASAVVIGAGTGLTAAESVLREFVKTKAVSPELLPDLLWFVWSCASLDDLMWCWETLVREMTKMIMYEKRRTGRDFTELTVTGSNQIAWLGVTFYVTRLSKKEELDTFHAKMIARAEQPRDREPPEVRNVRLLVTNFLFNQIQAGALDDEDRHIRHLLKSVHQKSSMTAREAASMTVAFCGPSNLASVVNSAKHELSKLNINVEFSQDGQ